jgi:hypothetical protein
LSWDYTSCLQLAQDLWVNMEIRTHHFHTISFGAFVLCGRLTLTKLRLYLAHVAKEIYILTHHTSFTLPPCHAVYLSCRVFDSKSRSQETSSKANLLDIKFHCMWRAITVTSFMQPPVSERLSRENFGIKRNFHTLEDVSISLVNVSSQAVTLKVNFPCAWLSTTTRSIGGSGDTNLCIVSFGARWEWVTSFTKRTLYYRRKSPGSDWLRGLMGLSASGRFREEKNFLSPDGKGNIIPRL